MIAHIRGRLLEKRPNQVIVDVQGVGYDVAIPVSTFYQLPAPAQEIELFIHTHVREDALALYGFRTLREKEVFERLISVSGIGPKLAITILSGLEVDELVPAIRRSDVMKLTRIPGVGRKTAERLVVDLRDKLLEAGAAREPAPPGFSQVEEDVLSALVNLGYGRGAAEKSLRAQGAADNLGFEELLRKCLHALVR